jgi:26S proteasome regulatory subunit (ATPase 3-interacting protein)
VLDFLVKQNRPMSANDILSNFTGQLTKSVIDKALETLTSDQKIIEKLYGKQKVFMALQVIY